MCKEVCCRALVFLNMLDRIEKFPCNNALDVADFETSYPQFGFRVVDFVDLSHCALLIAYAANTEQSLVLKLDLVLRDLLAVLAEIVEGKVVDLYVHLYRPVKCLFSAWSLRKTGIARLNSWAVLLVEGEYLLAIGFEAAFVAN